MRNETLVNELYATQYQCPCSYISDIMQLQ